MSPSFWQNKKVLITGHTGFKGSWLSLWLQELGADVTGISIEPPSMPNLFQEAKVADGIKSLRLDIRDTNKIIAELKNLKPEIVFHLAAQSLVRKSYTDPVETYSTNVMGTLNILEAIRAAESVRVGVMVTTDKCYENKEWVWGYRESDAMGGYDPYSSSKGCAELLIASYRRSYFSNEKSTSLSSVRAGNVIGGGDWAQDRLIPDVLRSIQRGEVVQIRNPNSIRPWQHVLEPLSGYIQLAEKSYEQGVAFAEAWNFGPNDSDAIPVRELVQQLTTLWGDGATWRLDGQDHPHEAQYLKLDCSKARSILKWQPKWNIEQALQKIVNWHKLHLSGESARQVCLNQIAEYMSIAK